jgi:hypothetical protein
MMETAYAVTLAGDLENVIQVFVVVQRKELVSLRSALRQVGL